MSQKKHNQRHGFTLLELLVVISIIGILAAIAFSAFGTAQRQSRDARRRNDMKTFQNCMEQCYVESGYDYSTCRDDSGNFNCDGGLIDPKPSTTTPYAFSAAADTYSGCADLDGLGGNATDMAATGYGSTTDGGFYCVRQLQ